MILWNPVNITPPQVVPNLYEFFTSKKIKYFEDTKKIFWRNKEDTKEDILENVGYQTVTGSYWVS